MRVCILSGEEARAREFGIEHHCRSRRHYHLSRAKVHALVAAGAMVWLGKHLKAATYQNPRSWQKVYRRNDAGEVMQCNLQMVRG